jgi:outer membrane biosynthesis protein TonB
MSSEQPGSAIDVVTGVSGALIVHAALVGLILFNRGESKPAVKFVTMRTQMEATQLGTPSIGVVQAPTEAPATEAPRAAEQIRAPETPAPTTKKTAPKVEPKQATVTPNASKTTKVAPTAGSETGGKGTDLVNVDLGGTDFPFPTYQRNIVNRIAEQFRTSEKTLSAEVMFIIRRDGSVDVDEMKLLTRSGNYGFDNAALGAIEAVANRRLFGPLPAEFKDDALTVIFKFDPRIIRP